MGDFGSSVSQRGYDVKTCADRYLVYSSAFSNLKINFVTASYTGTMPAIDDPNEHRVVIPTNLGYFAPTIVVYNGSTSTGVSTSYLMADSLNPLWVEIHANSIEIAYYSGFDGGGPNPGDTLYFTVYSFLDTFDSYTAPVINTDTTEGAHLGDYGFRISKPGFDVKTCADIDCIMSSSFFTNIIHKKGVDSTGSIYHGLGYIPSFICFYKDPALDFLISANPIVAVNNNYITFDQSLGDLYYFIFKNKQV